MSQGVSPIKISPRCTKNSHPSICVAIWFGSSPSSSFVYGASAITQKVKIESESSSLNGIIGGLAIGSTNCVGIYVGVVDGTSDGALLPVGGVVEGTSDSDIEGDSE